MVAGHLQEKKGYYYIVLSYPDVSGKRKTKWITTGLTVKAGITVHSGFCETIVEVHIIGGLSPVPLAIELAAAMPTEHLPFQGIGGEGVNGLFLVALGGLAEDGLHRLKHLPADDRRRISDDGE